MNALPPATLEDAIRQSGEGWLIDWFTPPSGAIDHLRQVLRQVDQRARDRWGENAPDLSEASLLREYGKNPRRVQGFFQALGALRTPDMLLMAWRIIQGMEIKKVELRYLRQQSFEVHVVLETSTGGEDEQYDSLDVTDFKVFRHVGILTVDGRPVLDGFYPLTV